MPRTPAEVIQPLHGEASGIVAPSSRAVPASKRADLQHAATHRGRQRQSADRRKGSRASRSADVLFAVDGHRVATVRRRRRRHRHARSVGVSALAVVLEFLRHGQHAVARVAGFRFPVRRRRRRRLLRRRAAVDAVIGRRTPALVAQHAVEQRMRAIASRRRRRLQRDPLRRPRPHHAGDCRQLTRGRELPLPPSLSPPRVPVNNLRWSASP